MTDAQAKALATELLFPGTPCDLLLPQSREKVERIIPKLTTALDAERATVWEEAATLFEQAFEKNMVVQDVLDECRARGKGETP